MAAAADEPEIIEALLACKVPVDVKISAVCILKKIVKWFASGPDEHLLTPLHFAAYHGSLRAVNFLLSRAKP